MLLTLRDFKAMSNDTLGATACDTTRTFNIVRIHVDRLPAGTAKKLTKETGCRRVFGKVTGFTGGGPSGLRIVDVTALVDG